MLALNSPLSDPNALNSQVYKWLDVLFTILFMIEMLFKVFLK